MVCRDKNSCGSQFEMFMMFYKCIHKTKFIGYKMIYALILKRPLILIVSCSCDTMIYNAKTNFK